MRRYVSSSKKMSSNFLSLSRFLSLPSESKASLLLPPYHETEGGIRTNADRSNVCVYGGVNVISLFCLALSVFRLILRAEAGEDDQIVRRGRGRHSRETRGHLIGYPKTELSFFSSPSISRRCQMKVFRPIPT